MSERLIYMPPNHKQPTVKTCNRHKGRQAETYACAWYCRFGYQVIQRNWAYRGGEIDLIARSPSGIWIFVEVKSVYQRGTGKPERRIGLGKQDRIYRTAAHFMHCHGVRGQEARFDVVCLVKSAGHWVLRQYPNAFSGASVLELC